MKEDILAINLLRFLAALAVLCTHKFVSLVDAGYIPKSLGIFNSISQYGYLGVNLFFLISGFVITLSSEGRTFGQFVSARFIRLFPAFWICVSISTAIALFLSTSIQVSLSQFLANLTMQPHLFGEYTFIDGSYWTLGVELRFYCMVALVLLLKPFAPFKLQEISFWLTLPLFYYIFYFNPYHISWFGNIFNQVIYYFGAEYAQYFFAGIFLHEIYKNRAKLHHYLALGMCFVTAVIQAVDQAYVTNNPVIIMLHITLFFGIFLMISLKKIPNTAFAVLGTRYRALLITLGGLTYPLYLLHDNIMIAIFEALSKKDIPIIIQSLLMFFILGSVVYLVNQVDVFIREKWRQSTLVQSFLNSRDIPLLRKFL
jgi:peptidoglycan/LPS O-acetylase OafA/YrhL